MILWRQYNYFKVPYFLTIIGIDFQSLIDVIMFFQSTCK
jgi:hypothetical protein